MDASVGTVKIFCPLRLGGVLGSGLIRLTWNQLCGCRSAYFNRAIWNAKTGCEYLLKFRAFGSILPSLDTTITDPQSCWKTPNQTMNPANHPRNKHVPPNSGGQSGNVCGSNPNTPRGIPYYSHERKKSHFSPTPHPSSQPKRIPNFCLEYGWVCHGHLQCRTVTFPTFPLL